MPRALLIVCLALIACLPALADELLPTKSFGVTDRPRPEYDPRGLRVGSALLRPELTVGAVHNDNIYAREEDAPSDRITELAGGFTLASQGSRLNSALQGKIDSRLYERNTGENTTDWLAGASFGCPLASRSSAHLQTSFSHDHENRDDPAHTDQLPGAHAPSTLSRCSRGLRTPLPQRASISPPNGSRPTIGEAKLADGLRLDQSFKDRDTLTFRARAAHQVRETTALFLQAVRTELELPGAHAR